MPRHIEQRCKTLGCHVPRVTKVYTVAPSTCGPSVWSLLYRGADKSLARPGNKETRKHVRDARDFNNIETRAVIKFFFFFLQGKAPKEIHAILTETLACFLPGRTKDLSATLYVTLGAPRILKWLLEVWNICAPLHKDVCFTKCTPKKDALRTGTEHIFLVDEE